MSALKHVLQQADPEAHDPAAPITDREIRADVAAIVAAYPTATMSRSRWLGVVAASAAVVVGAGAVTLHALNPINVQLDPATNSTTDATATPSVSDTTQPTPTADSSTGPSQEGDYEFKTPRKVAPPVTQGDFSSSTRTIKTPAGNVVVKDMQPSAQQAVRFVQRSISQPKEYKVLYLRTDSEGAAFQAKVLRDDSPDVSSVRLAGSSVSSIDKSPEVSVFLSGGVDITLINKSSWEKLVNDPESVPSLCAGTDLCEDLDEELAYRLGHNLFDAERRGYILASLAKNKAWTVSASNISGAPGIKYTKKNSAQSANEPTSFVVNPANGQVRYFQGVGEEYLVHQTRVSRSDMQKDVKAAIENGTWTNTWTGGSKDSNCSDVLNSAVIYANCVRS